MKESIYTIPIADGFAQNDECPFCYIYKTLEQSAVSNLLSQAYMEETVRAQTDAQGFCGEHLQMLYDGQNRLGLALMLHTHMSHVIKNLSHMSTIHENCYICNKILQNFDRYIETFFIMWKKDDKIKQYVKNGKGFCLQHFGLIDKLAVKNLRGKELVEFSTDVRYVQTNALKRLETELDWFIKKFDYRYKDEPWGNSKDVLPRAMLKITSKKIGD